MKSFYLRLIFSMVAFQLHAQPLSFDKQDPYQSINRKVHDFNMAFDATFLKQPARVYQAVFPAPIRAGVNNFFTNIHLLPSMANDVLQGDWRFAIKDFWRFGINSTIGVAGIFDVAAGTFRLPPHSNDLGLTFAKWGNPTSPYLVLPFLGPSTIRDGMGMLFDFTIFSPYPLFPSVLFYPLAGLRYIDLRSQFLDQEPLLNQALDKYTFIRDAYLQHREYVITGKEPNAGAIYLDEDNELPVLPAEQNRARKASGAVKITDA